MFVCRDTEGPAQHGGDVQPGINKDINDVDDEFSGACPGNTSSMKSWNLEGEFASPYGITRYS